MSRITGRARTAGHELVAVVVSLALHLSSLEPSMAFPGVQASQRDVETEGITWSEMVCVETSYTRVAALLWVSVFMIVLLHSRKANMNQ